jgi:hypothetical protein
LVRIHKAKQEKEEKEKENEIKEEENQKYPFSKYLAKKLLKRDPTLDFMDKERRNLFTRNRGKTS